MAMADTLKAKAGPLPVWAWAALGTAGLTGFLNYRQKKAADAAAAAAAQQSSDSSSLGTVPISNLTTAAQPMPLQMGDTFVNVDTGGNSPPPSNPVSTSKPPTTSDALGLTRVSSPTMAKQLMQKGFNLFTVGGTQYYDPKQHVVNGVPGITYARVSSPTMSKQLAARGFKVITEGNTQFYNPAQKGVKAA